MSETTKAGVEIIGYGRGAFGVDAADGRPLYAVNMNEILPSFFDLKRDGREKRVILEPNTETPITLREGKTEVFLGMSVRLEYRA